MCSDRHKNHGCGQQKPEGTSSAMFDVGSAASLLLSRFNYDDTRNGYVGDETAAKCCEFSQAMYIIL